MTVSAEIEAQILRHYHAEKWRVGTIADQLSVHRDVVIRVLSQAGLPVTVLRRSSKVDPYLPFIVETLEKFPRLPASRLLDMVRERGYRGGPSHFRHIISCHRPKPKAEAYLRLRTLPGDQAQVDWAHFGRLTIGKAQRQLMAFVIVLSYSRRIFLRFFLNARLESFLRGHVEAFETWQGVPRVCLYDNLKSAVLERRGEAIRFNPALLAFAGHYRFEPRPVAVARGNEKGRVERAIRFVRSSFFAAREFETLEDLNRQADAWCQGVAADRACPEDTARTVREVFEDEVPNLLALPAAPFPVFETMAVRTGKTPYVRFDGNDYSIPHTEVRRPLTVLADQETVRITDGPQVLAEHRRSWDKGEQVETPEHIKALVKEKSAARQHRASDRLIRTVPAAGAFLAAAAGDGQPLARLCTELNDLLDQYGAEELGVAITETKGHNLTSASAVRVVLERRSDNSRRPPPVAPPLPSHVRDRDVVVRQPALGSYDRLKDQGGQ